MTSTLPVLHVAAVGDSLTSGHLTWSSAHPYTNILEANGILVSNFGVSGVFTEQMVAQMNRVVKPHHCPSSQLESSSEHIPFTYVVILGGTNDLGCGLLPDTVLENLEQLARMAAEAGIFPFLLTVPPLGRHICSPADAALRTEVNDKIKQLCTEQGFGFIDLFAAVVSPTEQWMRDELTHDQLHFNAKGYDEMGEMVLEAIASHYERKA
jgi:acyl-CoA thioesterase-1